MPGIVGFLSNMPREEAEPKLRLMVEAISHESFYTTGTWIDESLGVYVGWAVRKGSFADGMPIWNERRDVCLIFSGEEFPHADGGDPSYLIRAYEEAAAFPAGLNGRFHGVVADRTRGTALLFNDRYGMHRLYYHESKEAVYFAAEAKAILAAAPDLRRLSQRALGELIACGCVMENRTLFDGVHVLPGASAWMCRRGSVLRKGTFFQPREWEDQAPLEPEDFYHQVRDVFSRNLPRYFRTREPMAMSLTGGLDSRMILALHHPPAGSLPCYTFGGTFRDCHDVTVARRVARQAGQPHQVIGVGQEFLSQFSRYAERAVYLTDGCADVTHSADLYVNERARAIAPVRMTGNYGGEVLRRIRAFKPTSPLVGVYRPEVLSSVDHAKETYAGLLESHPVSFAVFQQAPWHHFGLLALEETQLAVRTPFLDNDLVAAVFRAPASLATTNDVSLRLIKEGDAALYEIPTDRGFGGSRGTMAAAASQRLLDFSFKAEYAYDYGMPQSLARMDRLLSPLHLERLFLGRHKFSHFRVWYRDALSHYVREMLLDPKSLSRPYLERGTVETIVNGHLKGSRNYTVEIHKLLTLELIHRLFVDFQPAVSRRAAAIEVHVCQ